MRIRMTMRMISLAVAVILLPILTVDAESTNSLSDAEIQGRALAQKILAQWPSENSTNSGIVEIRGENGRRTELPFMCTTMVSESNWQNRYEAKISTNGNWANLIITHSISRPNRYLYFENQGPGTPSANSIELQGMDSSPLLWGPFAGSDFFFCDLGLEFFHWPLQKVIKKEFHRNCPCAVLESTNPHPSTNGYSRVVCWIDDDSLGVVEAYAYDMNGKKLKNFYPKNLEKVNGQYQVQTMIMENLQTGSRSRLDFDLNK